MSERTLHLNSIVQTIGDYRQGQIARITEQHVEKWLAQFEGDNQDGILAELDHVFQKTYITKQRATKFLTELVVNPKLAGADPCAFWQTSHLLTLQTAGNSQRDLLELFASPLRDQCGLEISDCGDENGAYIYLDDVIFTGNRVKNDIVEWVKGEAPKQGRLDIVVMAFHWGGQYYAETKIQEACKTSGKQIKTTWWSILRLEDRKTYTNDSDVLRPKALPDVPLAKPYEESLTYPPAYRTGHKVGENGFFSSPEGRNLLEQELLIAGLRVREMCPNLNKYQRPLGNMLLESLGFGSLVVTYRNCANNCPLALWAGHPWLPLFQRRTN